MTLSATECAICGDRIDRGESRNGITGTSGLWAHPRCTFRQEWESRPCMRCRWPRKRVLVSYRTFIKDGMPRTYASFADYCQACQLLDAAERHEDKAAIMRRKAQDLLGKR